jgi:hypothetical protein
MTAEQDRIRTEYERIAREAHEQFATTMRQALLTRDTAIGIAHFNYNRETEAASQRYHNIVQAAIEQRARAMRDTILGIVHNNTGNNTAKEQNEQASR